MLTAEELVNRMLEYDSSVSKSLVEKAYAFAEVKHAHQIRASGEPYFSHPASVAEILVEMKMDQYSVCTGLLHDVVEDTDTQIDLISLEFGDVIARLVDGVTKLNRIDFRTKTQKQAENFRKFIVAIAADVRVLIVKLADRLHNMRTIHFIQSEEKRQRIATETLEIYAPLAERIGMQNILEELQDVCFKVLYKKERNAVKQKLQFVSNKSQLIQEIIENLRVILERKGVTAEISGRAKTPYSIWKKMHKQNISFDQLTDIMAFRVIVQSVDECYRALYAIHTNFQAISSRFKDYISTPKLNNYQSIHTSVFGPFSQKIEIQIRTPEMHEVAETGIAAHWSYKENITNNVDPQFSQYKWIRSLLTVIDKNSQPSEVLENTKLEMFDNEVFCFTPQGEIISLPKGATCLDMAYSIHTFIGNTCMKAKVNGTMMPLNTKLNNGDKVEIITSPYTSPSKEWLNFVITGKAKSCIKKYVKLQERSEYILLGYSLVKQMFEKLNKDFDEKRVIDKLIGAFNCKNRTVFYQKLAIGHIPFQKVQAFIKTFSVLDLEPVKARDDAKAPSGMILVSNTDKKYAIHYADCCTPIPGDPVIGVLRKDQGVIVHKASCEKVLMLDESARISVSWNKSVKEFFLSKVKIVTINQPGSIAQITTTISSYGVNISDISVPYSTPEFETIEVAIEIEDKELLEKLCAALRTNIRVKTVECI